MAKLGVRFWWFLFHGTQCRLWSQQNRAGVKALFSLIVWLEFESEFYFDGNHTVQDLFRFSFQQA